MKFTINAEVAHGESLMNIKTALKISIILEVAARSRSWFNRSVFYFFILFSARNTNSFIRIQFVFSQTARLPVLFIFGHIVSAWNPLS